MKIIYRKSDLELMGTVPNNMTIEQEIELNVIPNFGGLKEDYSFIETELNDFHLENKNGVIIVVENFREPTIVEDKPTKAEVEFAEYVLATEDRIVQLENKILGGI